MQQENVQLRMERNEDSFLQGVKDCVPTLLGYLSIGFAAGVVGHTSGLSVLEVTLMSVLIYAGSAQFIIAGMVAAQGSIAAIIFTVFIVNLRHLLLSAAVSPYFRHLTAFKTMIIGSLLTDETFGVAINKAANTRALSESWMNGLNVTAYLNWILATMAGAFLGQWITNPEKFGLDFALSAMFIGLLVLQMIGRKKLARDLVVILCAVGIVVGVGMVTSGSVAVIIATVSAATIGVLIERWK
ncbi:4-azaleucine resistance probable transporter AzlC [Paenibacillus catalpae]|uniref:4-azaleucine resistance probable transporter AzlC n=1 Tax=Paenibacillus catalpae TaxID=1045775 RepID=A0A1I1VEW2_9BACL|nr:AzlC family ABC transporter permease [Paenibacillus catalpae]SFD81464.1 4-azaleucine resistance probable transporter AzlC [Paenibacillus catalpae]